MPTVYHMANDDERKWADYAMRQFHPKLESAGLRIGVMFAHNPEGPPVSHGGYPAAATIKIMSLKDRVSKGYDVELLIDEDAWELKTREERIALCDHELSHLVVVEAEEPDPSGPWWKTDDIGRPKLKAVKGDWNVGDGFAAVVARHGENALEYANIRAAKRMADQAAELEGGIEIVEKAAV